MYRVLLVDDEAWILTGLQAMIDWKSEGFDICATASNGIEAEEKALQVKPDIILADIRMPGCDGLTLLRRIRQAGCTALYAIISGYAEFAYAQEGIKLGACGYLLKPVEEEELLTLLRSARKALLERYEKLVMDELELETGLIASLYPEECWITVVYGGEELFADRPVQCCRLSRFSRLYLSGEPMFISEDDVPINACAGVKCYCQGRGESFAEAVASCREASWQGFIQPKKRLFCAQNIRGASMPTAATPQALIQHCRERLSEQTVRNLYALYLTVQGCPDGIMPDTPEWILEHFESAEQLLEKLETDLLPCDEFIDGSVSVAAYLKEHFLEDISLDTVSHALSMSGSSVRRVLLQESGDTFQHYLVMLRMERACVLLKKAGRSINEVAYSSGFHDALYFRRVFKKWFGLTPSDYRARLDTL